MSDECNHVAAIRDVTPSALGCEECLKIGSEWVHLLDGAGRDRQLHAVRGRCQIKVSRAKRA
jgi:hypothetical protein